VQNRVILKQEGLDRLLVYDRSPRKALVDHFYPGDVTLDDLRTCRDIERGDFVAGAYLSKLSRSASRVVLTMERPGWADGHALHVRKTIALEAGSRTLDIHYVLEGLPQHAALYFAVEINLAGLAGHAPDRYYTDRAGNRLGMLDTVLDLPTTDGLNLSDEWLGMSAGLSWSHPAGLWCFPIETVSQSEGGFEGVYQSSAVIPHWQVKPDASGRWERSIRWTIDTTISSAPAEAAAAGSREPLATTRAGLR
jgi:alpha-amylase